MLNLPLIIDSHYINIVIIENQSQFDIIKFFFLILHIWYSLFLKKIQKLDSMNDYYDLKSLFRI